MNKLISMCFPIYNRIDAFKYTFSRTIEEVVKLDSNEIEVVVSVNPDEKTLNETKEFLLEMQKKTDIRVNINETNIGIGGNGRKVFEMATGKYIWMIGDDDFLLPGCLERVFQVIKQYPDVGWIHLEHARLDGYPNDEKACVFMLSNDLFDKKGYFRDGKKIVTEAHNKMGANVLFSSTNLYLKEAWEKIANEHKEDNPQLAATFFSAAKGGAYLDDKISVVAGGERSWNSHVDYSLAINYFEDMYYAIGYDYSKKEIDRMIRYIMRHEKLLVWFRAYRLLLKDKELGKKALLFYFDVMPIQTVVTTISLPLIGCYLCVRHTYRKFIRKKVCRKYALSADADPYVVSRLAQ